MRFFLAKKRIKMSSSIGKLFEVEKMQLRSELYIETPENVDLNSLERIVKEALDEIEVCSVLLIEERDIRFKIIKAAIVWNEKANGLSDRSAIERIRKQCKTMVMESGKFKESCPSSTCLNLSLRDANLRLQGTDLEILQFCSPYIKGKNEIKMGWVDKKNLESIFLMLLDPEAEVNENIDLFQLLKVVNVFEIKLLKYKLLNLLYIKVSKDNWNELIEILAIYQYFHLDPSPFGKKLKDRCLFRLITLLMDRPKLLLKGIEKLEEASSPTIRKLKVGLTYQLQDKPLEAIECYKNLLRTNKEISSMLLATIYLKYGDYEGAIKSVQTALEVNAQSAPPILLLSRIYFNQRLYEQALDVIEKLLEREPANIDALVLKGGNLLPPRSFQCSS